MRRNEREIHSRETIEKILTENKTIFIGMNDEYPYVLPLSHGYEFIEDQLIFYFHSAFEGKKLELLKKDNKVGFALGNEGQPTFGDTNCAAGYLFSSVIGFGKIEFISDIQEQKKALVSLFKTQFNQEVSFTDEEVGKVLIYKLVVEEYSGKQRTINKSY